MYHTTLTGNSVGFNFKNLSAKDIKRSNVAGHIKNDRPRQAESFLAQVIIMNYLGQIMENFLPSWIVTPLTLLGSL